MGEVGWEVGGVESWMISLYLFVFLWYICMYLRKQHESASFIIFSKMKVFFGVARSARARFDPTYSTYCTAHAGPYVNSTNQTGLLVTS